MRPRHPESIKVLPAPEFSVTVLERNRGEFPDFELEVVLDPFPVLFRRLSPQCTEKRLEKPREWSDRAWRIWSVV